MKEKVITDCWGVCHWICPQIKVIICLNIPFYSLTQFWKTSYLFFFRSPAIKRINSRHDSRFKKIHWTSNYVSFRQFWSHLEWIRTSMYVLVYWFIVLFQIPRTSKKGHYFNNPKSAENISWFRKGELFWIWLLIDGTQDQLRKHLILQFLLLMYKVDRNFMQFSVSKSCIEPKYISVIYNLRHFCTSGLLLNCCFLVVHYFLSDNVEKPSLFDLHPIHTKAQTCLKAV